MKTINPKEVSVGMLHGYLLAAIAPRPIAFASTIDKAGNVNLSPFSFFNVFGSNPPTLIFSPNKRVRDNSSKHTLENVLEHDEVVINMVDYAMVEQMSLSSCEYAKEINEFDKAGLTSIASTMVQPPRVGEAKAAFECKVKQIIHMGEGGGAANLVICEVLLAHFSEDILNENGFIDQTKTDWVARMGGDWYCRASGSALFEVPKPNLKLGIGVDNIPAHIRQNPIFTGNDLGRLGNIERLPTPEEINAFKQEHPECAENPVEFAKQQLAIGNVWAAWLGLL